MKQAPWVMKIALSASRISYGKIVDGDVVLDLNPGEARISGAVYALSIGSGKNDLGVWDRDQSQYIGVFKACFHPTCCIGSKVG